MRPPFGPHSPSNRDIIPVSRPHPHPDDGTRRGKLLVILQHVASIITGI